MADDRKHEAGGGGMGLRARVALILILVVDAGYVAWGAMAAAWPNRLLGPGGKSILVAGYEGFSQGSWSELLRTSPGTARYIEIVFRMYGLYCAVFGLMACFVALTAFRRGERWAWWALGVGNVLALVSAMTYDRTVKAIGPFELTEYLGLAMIAVALALTARFRPAAKAALPQAA